MLQRVFPSFIASVLIRKLELTNDIRKKFLQFFFPEADFRRLQSKKILYSSPSYLGADAGNSAGGKTRRIETADCRSAGSDSLSSRAALRDVVGAAHCRVIAVGFKIAEQAGR